MSFSRHSIETLVEDERGRGFPAVLKYGPYLFVSGSDGHRDINSEKINLDIAGDAIAQCRNAYGRIAKRLEKAGYGGDCAVWIQNFTSGQHWRLERMALWPEYFGEVGHGQAVSFGAQTKLNGINMITASVLAVTPDIQRVVGVKQPTRGRASRITRVGDLIFVIGVRGHEDPLNTANHAPEETDDSFDIQLEYCFGWLKSHLSKLNAPIDRLVRVDTCLRDADSYSRYISGAEKFFDGRMPFANYAVGTLLGARLEQEVGGVAAAPGVPTEIKWLANNPKRAEATKAGGLVFASSCSGLLDAPGGSICRELYGDLGGQTRQSLANVEKSIGRFSVGLDRLLRLDVFVRNIYAEDRVIGMIKDVLEARMPTLNVIGTEPAQGADIEIVAIAGA